MLLVVMIPHCFEKIIKRFRARNRIVPFLIRMVKEKSLNDRFLLRVLKTLHIYKRQCFFNKWKRKATAIFIYTFEQNV